MSIPGTFTGAGTAPRVSSAEALTPTQVKVTFSEPMTHSAELVDADTYTIDEDVGSAARVVTGVTPEPSTAPSWVVLELDGALTIGTENYTVIVDNTVVDEAGNTLDAAHDEATFSGMHAPGALDHVALSRSRLLAQFKGKPKLEAFFAAMASGHQSIEQAALDVLSFRSLDTSFGATMHRVGENISMPRLDRDDADFRVFLKGKAMALASRGRPDELIAVLQALDNGHAPSAISYEDSFPAGFILHCEVLEGEKERGRAFAAILHGAKPNAVKMLLKYVETGVDLFGWALDAGNGDTVEFAGWALDAGNGDTATPEGYWAEASSGMSDEF